MKLRDLFSDEAEIDAKFDPQAETTAVTGLAVDSRVVKKGDLFFALSGSKTDGARFIDAAIASGAVAIAGDHSPSRISVPFRSNKIPWHAGSANPNWNNNAAANEMPRWSRSGATQRSIASATTAQGEQVRRQD